MSTKAQYRGGVATFYDGTSFESVKPLAPILFEEDFLGKAFNVTHWWTAIDVSSAGLTTPVLLTDGANGLISLPLDVTSEAQESGLTWGDHRPLVLNRGLVFECRLALITLPTLLSEAVWGLAGDKNAVADTVAEGIWFKADGDGVIVAESDDATTNNDDKATGITVVAGAYHIYRIDCTVPTDIKFYVDGARVAEATTFSANAVPTLALQPYFHNAKASGAGLGDVGVDYVRVWQNRA